VRDKRVLDIASGEGYGTAVLRRAGSRSVVGIDVSQDICSRAREKYGEPFCAGDAHAIPLSDHSVDVIVSFETIEHVEGPDTFLDECVRVLVPKGILIVSTPNKAVHSESPEPNPFHCSEMNEGDFLSLLGSPNQRGLASTGMGPFSPLSSTIPRTRSGGSTFSCGGDTVQGQTSCLMGEPLLRSPPVEE